MEVEKVSSEDVEEEKQVRKHPCQFFFDEILGKR